jgi:flavorubredoxin
MSRPGADPSNPGKAKGVAVAEITEIAADTYRINVAQSGKPVSFSFFLINDEQPTLVETSYRRLFPETIDAVRKIIDPASIRHIVIPHFEGDECGALNLFLEVAPHAIPLAGPVGTATSIPDFADREPIMVDEETDLDLGAHRLGFLVTPYVHAWDSILAYDRTTGTLFSSDLFMQPGHGPASTDADISEEMVDYIRTIGLFPSRAHLDAALDKIETLGPTALACHHGTVKTGNIPRYLAAFREHDVTGLPPNDPVHRPAR